ncbi:MAG: TolC family protein, partial [Bacteriovoracales bacterium]
MKKFCFLALIFFSTGNAAVYHLKLKDAEDAVLGYSNNIKASVASEDSALENADSKYVSLWPKLSLEGQYQYNFTLPEFAFEGNEPVVFGTTNVFNVGPYVSYTLWDSHSLKDTYEASSFTAAAKGEDKKNTYLVELRNVREAYIEVQRGLEEVRLTNETLDLSRAQH